MEREQIAGLAAELRGQVRLCFIAQLYEKESL